MLPSADVAATSLYDYADVQSDHAKLADCQLCDDVNKHLQHVVIARQPIMHLLFLTEKNLHQSWPKVYVCVYRQKDLL